MQLTFNSTDPLNFLGNPPGLNTTASLLLELGVLTPRQVLSAAKAPGSVAAQRRLRRIPLAVAAAPAPAPAAPSPRRLSLAFPPVPVATDPTSASIVVSFSVLVPSMEAARSAVATAQSSSPAAMAAAMANATASLANATGFSASEFGVEVDAASVRVVVLTYSYDSWGLVLDFLLRNIGSVVGGALALMALVGALCVWEPLARRCQAHARLQRADERARFKARALQDLRLRLMRARVRGKLRDLVRAMRMTQGNVADVEGQKLQLLRQLLRTPGSAAGEACSEEPNTPPRVALEPGALQLGSGGSGGIGGTPPTPGTPPRPGLKFRGTAAQRARAGARGASPARRRRRLRPRPISSASAPPTAPASARPPLPARRCGQARGEGFMDAERGECVGVGSIHAR